MISCLVILVILWSWKKVANCFEYFPSCKFNPMNKMWHPDGKLFIGKEFKLQKETLSLSNGRVFSHHGCKSFWSVISYSIFKMARQRTFCYTWLLASIVVYKEISYASTQNRMASLIVAHKSIISNKTNLLIFGILSKACQVFFHIIYINLLSCPRWTSTIN